MNRDDIIRMAREAGIKDPAPARQGFKMYANPQRLERFAALVAAHKRPWIGLTNEEIMDCTHHMTKGENETWVVTDSNLFEFAHILEEWLKEKNK